MIPLEESHPSKPRILAESRPASSPSSPAPPTMGEIRVSSSMASPTHRLSENIAVA